MQLSDVLSKPLTNQFEQVDSFLGKTRLPCGRQRKISAGKVWLPYYCRHCGGDIVFISGEELFCIGVNDRLISIDCVLRCPRCGELVPVWFLVESKDMMYERSPEVRVLKRMDRLTENVLLSRGAYPQYAEWLEKADRAYRSELGAGAIVYLRKILEDITVKTAEAAGIKTKKQNGKQRPFREILEAVKVSCPIIPEEFAEDGYKLFEELSDVIHGDYDEQLGLKKYDALHRLVVGILDNVKNRQEMRQARETLGWNGNGEVQV